MWVVVRSFGVVHTGIRRGNSGCRHVTLVWSVRCTGLSSCRCCDRRRSVPSQTVKKLGLNISSAIPEGYELDPDIHYHHKRFEVREVTPCVSRASIIPRAPRNRGRRSLMMLYCCAQRGRCKCGQPMPSHCDILFTLAVRARDSPAQRKSRIKVQCTDFSSSTAQSTITSAERRSDC